MSSPFSVRTMNDQLRSSMETSIYRNTVRLYNPSIALDNEVDAREMVARDAAICATMDAYCYDVAATGFQIVPGGKDRWSLELANRTQEAFENANVADMTYESAGYVFWGRSYSYLDGARKICKLGNATLPRNYWMPTWIHDIDINRVIFVPERGRDKEGKTQLNVVRALWDVTDGGYKKMTPEFERNLIEVKWGDTEDKFGYGRGLIDSIFFYWRAKAVAMRDGLQGLARWAKSIIVGKLDPDRPADSTLTNEQLAQDLLEKLTNQAQNGIIVIPKDSGEIEVHETTGTGHELVKWFIQYFDGEIARLILGSKMPTGAGEDGSSAGSEGKSKTQERTTSRRIMFHRNRIAEAFSRSMIPTFLRHNWPLFLADDPGFRDAKLPKWRIIDEAFDDPHATMELIGAGLENGFEIPAEWAHEKTGIPMPKVGEAILKKAVQPSPFGGGGPFGEDGFPAPGSDSNDGGSDGSGSEFSPAGGAGANDAPQKPKPFRFPARRRDFREYEIPPAAVAAQPPAIHVHAQMPDLPDVAAAKKKEEFYRAELEATKKSFEAAMDRPIVVSVAAPNVAAPHVDVHVAAPPPANVEVHVAAPNVQVAAPNVTVEAAEAPKIVVEQPAREKSITIKRDKDGKIMSAEIIAK